MFQDGILVLVDDGNQTRAAVRPKKEKPFLDRPCDGNLILNHNTCSRREQGNHVLIPILREVAIAIDEDCPILKHSEGRGPHGAGSQAGRLLRL
jgi:hypothetical protein